MLPIRAAVRLAATPMQCCDRLTTSANAGRCETKTDHTHRRPEPRPNPHLTPKSAAKTPPCYSARLLFSHPPGSEAFWMRLSISLPTASAATHQVRIMSKSWRLRIIARIAPWNTFTDESQ